MSTYPIHIFVSKDRQIFRAADTDQHHSSAEKHKRLRSVTQHLADGTTRRISVISAGMWYPSQLPYGPFLKAVTEAEREAEREEGKNAFIEVDDDDNFVRVWPADTAGEEWFRALGIERNTWGDPQYTYTPWASAHECKQILDESRIRNPILLRALWLCSVQGYTLIGALKVLGHADPQRNGRRQLQRIIKAAKARLHEIRCNAAGA